MSAMAQDCLSLSGTIIPCIIAILALSASFILRYERQHLLPYFVHCITCSVQWNYSNTADQMNIVDCLYVAALTWLAIWEAESQCCLLTCSSDKWNVLLASSADVAHKIHGILLKTLSDKFRMFDDQALHYQQHCAGARLTKFLTDCAGLLTPQKRKQGN
jgi:hypothetical protein